MQVGRKKQGRKEGRKQTANAHMPLEWPSHYPSIHLSFPHFLPLQISLSFQIIHTFALLLIMTSIDIQRTPPEIRQSIYRKAIIDLRHTVGIEYVAWMEDTAARVSLVISISWLILSFRCLINSLS